MATLSPKEKRHFEEILGMNSGYVLDFSNNTFARFVEDVIDLDIYGGIGYTDYCSKANKLRQIWEQEPDAIVGELMDELLTYYEDSFSLKDEEIPEKEIMKIKELRNVAKRLKGSSIPVSLPIKKEETLKTLLEDIQDSLAKNKPTLVLDRLHTFAMKFLRQICIEHGIEIEDAKGNKYALHGLAGKLKKLYEKNEMITSSFALIAVQNSISLFDSYNDIRNDKSYAHDNQILNNIEADFVVRAMANVLTFLDSIEIQRKKLEKLNVNKNNSFEFELPF